MHTIEVYKAHLIPEKYSQLFSVMANQISYISKYMPHTLKVYKAHLIPEYIQLFSVMPNQTSYLKKYMPHQANCLTISQESNFSIIYLLVASPTNRSYLTVP